MVDIFIMKQIFIYYLKHPITNEIRYIGKTSKKLKYRLYNHIYNAKHTKHNKHLSNWILQILNEGLLPIMDLLEICDESIWKEQEQFWISLYPNLINLTLGGDGCEGLQHTEETLLKLRESRSGFKHTEQFKQDKSDFFKTIIRTDSWKNNISKSRQGYKPTEAALKNQSEAHKGYIMPDAQKEKIRASLKGRKRPQIVIDKIKATKNKNKDIVES